MGKTSTDIMKELIPSLPEKDIELGFKFLEKRDFESLHDLVKSAIVKVRRSQSSAKPREEYKNIDLDSLMELNGEIGFYRSILEYPSDISEDFIDEDINSEYEE